MTKHTPGPWEYRPAMNYTGFSIAPLGTLPTLAAVERCGDCMTMTCFNFPGNTEANARLIAAAPEIYNLLTDLVKEVRKASYHSEIEHLGPLVMDALEVLKKVSMEETK